MTAPRPLGPCNILTVEEAARELGMRDADALAWLESRGLIRMVRGRRRVVAGQLVAAMDPEDQASAPAPFRGRRVALG